MSNPTKKLTVTAIPNGNGRPMTAFFNELPALVVQGFNDEEILGKLASLLESYIKRLDSLKGNLEIQTT